MLDSPMDSFGSITPDQMLDTDPTIDDQKLINQEAAIDLSGEDLERFIKQMHREFERAKSGRLPFVTAADAYERRYNLEPYKSDEVPYMDALSIRLPTALSRVDKTAAELAGAFDRDGAPIYGALPISPSGAGLASHVEKMFHDLLTEADAMRQYRLTIKRALKVGVGFICTEVVSRPINAIRAAMMQPDPTAGESSADSEYENTLTVRSVKLQDMYWTPVACANLKDAGFVGERFQLPRWRLEDYEAQGFYTYPTDGNGEVKDKFNYGITEPMRSDSEDLRRLGITDDGGSQNLMSDQVDLCRAWMRFRPEGAVRSQLYYVVFPINQPSAVLRLKENQYTLLDEPPYTAWNVDEGDGLIVGRSYLKLLEDLSTLLDTLTMLRIEQGKRAYSNIYLARNGSMIADTLAQRRGESTDQDEFADSSVNIGEYSNLASGRLMPDEVLETENPQGDLVMLPLTQTAPQQLADEQQIQNYMNEATVDTSPLGGIRSAFEVRQAASQMAAKLKSYLKVLVSTGLQPHIEQVRAQVWEYMMPGFELSDQIKLIQYGDTIQPITISDFFSGIRLVPSGSTTSADQAVALTNTADLMNQVIPLLAQTPGIVKDVPRAIREILKLRLKALGIEAFETIIGLEEPNEQDMQKALMYAQILRQLNGSPTGSMPQNAMGGEGGIGLGMPNVAQGNPQASDQTGGSQAGIAPNMQEGLLNAQATPGASPLAPQSATLGN